MKNFVNRLKTIILLFTLINLTSQAQNINISNGYVFDGEPFLAVNPNNSQHLVVAWMGYKYLNYIVIKTKVSFDGGQTWSNSNYAPHTNPVYGSADPSIDFDANGNVYLCYIDYSTAIDSGSVYIRKSTDGGLNWGIPVEVIEAHSDPGKYPLDRPWISIDRSGGSYEGNIYITTMPPNVFGYLPPPYHPYFIRSIDGGSSFEPWVFLDTTGWLAGNFISQPMPTHAVSSSGIFHAAYPSWVLSQNIYPQYILASSADGGDTFIYKTIIDLSENVAFSDSLAKKGYLLRSDPIDPDHLAFFILLKNYGDADVFMLETIDGGNTWSTLIRVNDDPVGNNKMQDMVWADFDSDGDLIVIWRDRRNAPDSTYTTSSEIWGAFRDKDSANFSENFLVSDVIVPYDTILASAGNDFMCVKLINDTLNAVWGDTRNGYLNIWYYKKDMAGNTVSVQEITHEPIEIVFIFPNPTKGIIQISGADELSEFVVYVYDNSGKQVSKVKNQSIIDLSSLQKGIYLVRIETPEKTITNKMIKIE